MGCDIHGWIEKKIDNKWVAIAELEDKERNYKRFSRLANVRTRCNNDEVLSPKGVPDDISNTTKYHVDELASDGHSHSFIDLEKAFIIFKQTQNDEFYILYTMTGLDIDNDCNSCGQKILSNNLYRLVFWFDN